LEIAKASNVSLTLCTVITDSRAIQAGAQWSPISYQALLDNAAARLDLLARQFGRDAPVKLRVGSGSVPRGILDIAAEIEADLIVLASPRPATINWDIGANTSRIVRHAPCAVFVVRD
jgi:universal stress protein G/universal stress protein F